MILAHAIVGITAGNYLGSFWFLLLGSVLPDVDHLYVLLKHRMYTFGKITDSIRFEKRYHIHYKTKLFHSVFGAFVISAPVYLYDHSGGVLFFLAYLFHLVLDWFDYDEKYFLFPLNIKFRGILPIFSRQEIVFTMIIFAVMVESLLR